ncbi:MAG: hypothetical protein P8J33_15670 [Pirellulaceae bacterium]|nr:hypothetical protein [Pirellulaceae bacterium]
MNFKLLPLFSLALVFPAILFAQDSKDAEILKQVKNQAQMMVDATLKGNYETVVKLTYPPALETIGGIEKAIEVVKAQMAQMKEGGMKIVSFKLGDLKEIARTAEMAFVIIPTNTEMTIPQADVTAVSYLLGISADNGKTWSFVDGAALDPQPKWLPKLPENFKLPASTPPKIKAK